MRYGYRGYRPEEVPHVYQGHRPPESLHEAAQRTLRAWANYELKNLLAREEYARIGHRIDSRYGDGAVTGGVVVSLPDRTRAVSSLGQVSSLGWSA